MSTDLSARGRVEVLPSSHANVILIKRVLSFYSEEKKIIELCTTFTNPVDMTGGFGHIYVVHALQIVSSSDPCLCLGYF